MTPFSNTNEKDSMKNEDKCLQVAAVSKELKQLTELLVLLS